MCRSAMKWCYPRAAWPGHGAIGPPFSRISQPQAFWGVPEPRSACHSMGRPCAACPGQGAEPGPHICQLPTAKCKGLRAPSKRHNAPHCASLRPHAPAPPWRARARVLFVFWSGQRGAEVRKTPCHSAKRWAAHVPPGLAKVPRTGRMARPWGRPAPWLSTSSTPIYIHSAQKVK